MRFLASRLLVLVLLLAAVVPVARAQSVERELVISSVSPPAPEGQMYEPIDVDHLFKYHAPKPEQLPKYEALRESAKSFAKSIVELTPPGADQSAALRKVREAVMTANASIALERPPIERVTPDAEVGSPVASS